MSNSYKTLVYLNTIPSSQIIVFPSLITIWINKNDDHSFIRLESNRKHVSIKKRMGHYFFPVSVENSEM